MSELTQAQREAMERARDAYFGSEAFCYDEGESFEVAFLAGLRYQDEGVAEVIMQMDAFLVACSPTIPGVKELVSEWRAALKATREVRGDG